MPFPKEGFDEAPQPNQIITSEELPNYLVTEDEYAAALASELRKMEAIVQRMLNPSRVDTRAKEGKC
jgi:hypothetical protein